METTPGIGVPELLILCCIPLTILALLAAIVAGAFWFVRRNRTRSVAPVVESNALGILKGRYARGEITREQFEAMRKDLERQ